jgi:hypothetical protein
VGDVRPNFLYRYRNLISRLILDWFDTILYLFWQLQSENGHADLDLYFKSDKLQLLSLFVGCESDVAQL